MKKESKSESPLIGERSETNNMKTGLKVIIDIQCETEDEILSHLSVIRREIKKEIRRVGEITQPVELGDTNCYGDHHVIIKPTEI